MILTVSCLRECLRLDRRRGKLFWRRRPVAHFRSRHDRDSWNTRFAGREAGSPLYPGRPSFELSIDRTRKRVLVHRAIYALVHDRWPPHTVDHWNRVKSDNRPVNLKSATYAEQAQNRDMRADNTSGFQGVSKFRTSWKAQIKTNGKIFFLGLFGNPAEAHGAYRNAKAQLHTYQPE